MPNAEGEEEDEMGKKITSSPPGSSGGEGAAFITSMDTEVMLKYWLLTFT